MTTPSTALIVGGSSGIGKATAWKLLERGTDVLLLGRNQDKLAAPSAELSALGTVETVIVDLHDEQQTSNFIDTLDADPRHLKHLVNAAGVFKPTPFLEHDKADYDRYQDTNRAVFFITQAVARNMSEHGGGAIVNIGSMWARQAVKATPSSAYSMAKAGLHSLTQHLAMEFASADGTGGSVAIGATWVVKHLLEAGVAAESSTAVALRDLLQQVSRDEAVLHVLQCLPYLDLELQAGPATSLFATLFESATEHETAAVKARIRHATKALARHSADSP